MRAYIVEKGATSLDAVLVRVADSHSFEEAATLPCAGVTAWNAVMERPQPVGPASRVLIRAPRTRPVVEPFHCAQISANA